MKSEASQLDALTSDTGYVRFFAAANIKAWFAQDGTIRAMIRAKTFTLNDFGMIPIEQIDRAIG